MNDKAERFDELVNMLRNARGIQTEQEVKRHQFTFPERDYFRLLELVEPWRDWSAFNPSPAPQADDAAAIALAESKYWQHQSDERIFLLSLGAMAAATNIYLAVSGMQRAPWHPKK